MRKTAILSLYFLGLAMASMAQQPGKLTKKFFPDPKVEFETPAFNSRFGFTTYQELVTFLERLTSQNPYATIDFIGETQRGKKIPMVLISKPDNQPKVRVWLQGGIHGNEPASSEGLLVVLQELLTNSANARLLDRLEIAVVPMVNIDGYVRQNRSAKNGLDLNRDLIKLQIAETQQLKAKYSEYAPHVAIDFHEYNPFRATFRDFGDMGYTSFYDAMFLYSGDLNVEPEIKSLTNDLFVKQAKETFDELGYNHHDYFSPQDTRGKLYFNLGSSSARSSATSFALGNAVSVLMEIRGIRLNRNSFERRILITKTSAFSFLETAYNHHDEVLEGVLAAIASTESMQREVVADSRRAKEEHTIKFIDIAENEVVEQKFEIATANQKEIIISRERPGAYLLSPDQTQAVRNLEILGLDVTTLASDISLPVQIYRVDIQQVAAEKFQGYRPNIISTVMETRTIKFEKGTFVVRMDQKNANLAVTALEPENDNGFVRTRVVEAVKGEEVPIYRLMQEDLKKLNK